MEKVKLTRRSLILRTPAFFAGLLLLGNGLSASAAQPVKNPKRPPGTCGGWVDKDGNGCCDRSENGPKPCGKVNCPAHAENSKWKSAKKNGAPKGACVQWKDPDSQGYCELSVREESPCLCESCPANRNHVSA